MDYHVFVCKKYCVVNRTHGVAAVSMQVGADAVHAMDMYCSAMICNCMPLCMIDRSRDLILTGCLYHIENYVITRVYNYDLLRATARAYLL